MPKPHLLVYFVSCSRATGFRCFMLPPVKKHFVSNLTPSAPIMQEEVGETHIFTLYAARSSGPVAAHLFASGAISVPDHISREQVGAPAGTNCTARAQAGARVSNSLQLHAPFSCHSRHYSASSYRLLWPWLAALVPLAVSLSSSPFPTLA